MPTYDYICKACNHAVEIFHSMTEVKRKCPNCGKNALERQIGTGGAVIFKGSGFYQTDYRSESYKKAAAGEGGSGADKKPETPAASTGDTTKAPPASTKAEAKPTEKVPAATPKKPKRAG